MRQWHIWDFPDNLYVLLKKGVHEEFFEYCFSYCGGKRPYARFLNTSQSQVKSCWKKYTIKENKKYVQYFPLSFLKKSYPILNDDLINKLENGIEYFRVRAGNPIKVNLPIKESPELHRVVAHLLADGFAGIKNVPYYSNTCKELREQFKNDLKIFGDLHIYENTPNTTTCVFFPKPIANILRYIFSIEFTRPTKLPELIFKSSNECKIIFLRALYDDEGTASTAIVIKMNNLNIIKEIKNLVQSLGIKTNKINCNGGFSFAIKSDCVKLFKEKIGFSHPDKISRLNLMLNIKKRNITQRIRPLDWTRNEIMSLLNQKSMETFELCEELLLSIGGMYHHLNYLEDNNKIVRGGFKNKIIWKIKV